MADKEVRELMDAIRSGEHGPEGLTIVTEGKHAKIYFRGQPVHERRESGEMGAPLTLPLTPSDSRWYENTVRTLIRSKVLTEDPKKVDQQGLTPEQEAEREAERERREQRQEKRQQEQDAQREAAQSRQATTTLLRQRAERIFEPMGLWKQTGKGHSGWRGTIAEVARVAFHWGQKQQLDDAPGSEEGSKHAWRQLFRDEPLNPKNRAFLNAFIDEVARAANPTRFYHDMLRDLLGIGETRAPAAPAAAKANGVEPVAKEGEGPPLVSVQEVVEAVENAGGPITSAELAETLPDMTKNTKNWATWKAVDRGLIQRLARGTYAPVGYVPQEGDPTNGGAEPEPPEPDDEQIVDERVVINVEEELQVMDAQALESVVAPLVERLDAIAEHVNNLQAGRSENGPPTLALECLAEMVGQHITVGGGEDGGITDEVLALIDAKRDRALKLAKQIAALEVGS